MNAFLKQNVVVTLVSDVKFSPQLKNLKLWGPQNSGPYLYHTIEIHCEHNLTFFKKLVVFRVVFCVKHNHA